MVFGNVSSRSRFRVAAALSCVAAVVAPLSIPAPAAAQFDAEVERRMLADLMRDGKYQQALSEARRIEKIVKPGKSAVPGAGTRMYVELLIYRGTLERRMGNLDAADKTLTQAFKLVSDPAFQQYVSRNVPSSEKEQGTYYLDHEIPYLQLLDNGTEVLLERIRAVNQQRAAAAAKPATPPAKDRARETESGEQSKDGAAPDQVADDRDQIVTWFRRVDDLIRMSQSARASLRGQIGEAGKGRNSAAEAAYADSPQARVTVSLSRPYRFVGIRYLEASKLPWTLSFDTDSVDDTATTGRKGGKPAANESPEERQRQATSQRRRAAAYLQRSAELAEVAMAPVLELIDDGTEDGDSRSKLPPAVILAARKEVARVRAERLVPMAEVVLIEDNVVAARAMVDSAITALREAEAPNHPELARPLITSAEVSFALARRCLATRDAVGANWQANAAVQALTEARSLLTAQDSAFDAAAPLHAWLASQLAVAESFAASSSQTAAQRTAADAAARRALQAIKAGQKPPPKPAPDSTPTKQ
jgi:hypothetical protein